MTVADAGERGQAPGNTFPGACWCGGALRLAGLNGVVLVCFDRLAAPGGDVGSAPGCHEKPASGQEPEIFVAVKLAKRKSR